MAGTKPVANNFMVTPLEQSALLYVDIKERDKVLRGGDVVAVKADAGGLQNLMHMLALNKRVPNAGFALDRLLNGGTVAFLPPARVFAAVAGSCKYWCLVVKRMWYAGSVLTLEIEPFAGAVDAPRGR